MSKSQTLDPTLPLVAVENSAPTPPLEEAVELTEEKVAAAPLPEQAPPFKISALTILTIVVSIAFLYFARPVLLPIVLAVVAGMTLKPLIRWLSKCHIPPAIGAALVLSAFVSATCFGFVQLGKPALAWMNDADEHMAQLKQRFRKLTKPAAQLSQAAEAVKNLSTEAGEAKVQQVEVKTTRDPIVWVGWTGGMVAGLVETLALLYLLLASGDLFLQKLVRIMPTMTDKKLAVEFCHEVQQNISNFLFTVSMVNLALGAAVALGLALLGVPNAPMWGLLAALVNYVPYFGPIAGIVLLGTVGLITFDNVWQGLLPPAWYFSLHLLETNVVTPMLLGRRFALNPVMIFVSLIFWTWLWGVFGALLSVPILVSMRAICDRVPKLAAAGEFLSK